MSFNPQGYPFTALPTNLRGKIQPNQLAVLWVIQSYASKDDQECYPSLNTIAKSACMSKRTAQKIVNQLVSLGFLERKHQTGKNGQQGSNLYKVTIWHLANVPEPSIDERGKSCAPAPGGGAPAGGRGGPGGSPGRPWTIIHTGVIDAWKDPAPEGAGPNGGA